MTSHSDSENNHHHRSLPHSEDMEKGLLCSMILSRDVREHCIAHIPPVAFFIPAYAIIFRALCAWHKTGRPLDFPSFKLQLTEEGQLEEIVRPEPKAFSPNWPCERSPKKSLSRPWSWRPSIFSRNAPGRSTFRECCLTSRPWTGFSAASTRANSG